MEGKDEHIAHHKYYDHVPLPILITDKDGRIVYHNQELKKISPLKKEDIPHVSNLWELNKNTSLLDYLNEMSHSAEGHEVEVVLTSVQNEKNRVRLSHLKDDLVMLCCMETSTKEEKSLQDQLNENQQKLNSLTEENSDGIIFVDQEGTITNVNRALQEMIGYSKDEIIYRYEENISFKELARMRDHTNKGLKGEPQVYETSIRHKNGELIYLDVKTIPILINDCCIGVYSIFRDISGFKRAQFEALKQEEILRSLINSIPEFVVFQDQHGRVLELNNTLKIFFRRMGTTQSEKLLRKSDVVNGVLQ